jgi:hypothetical protein
VFEFLFKLRGPLACFFLELAEHVIRIQPDSAANPIVGLNLSIRLRSLESSHSAESAELRR